MSIRRVGVKRSLGARLGSAYAAAVVADKPVLYLRMNEASGSTWADSSASGASVTVVGSPTFGVAPALNLDGTAVTLSGSGQYGTLASGSIPAGIKSATALTVEAWFKTTSASIAQLIAIDDINGSGTARVFDLGINSTFSAGSAGNVRLDTFAGASPDFAFAQGGNCFHNGAWHHAVGVWNAGAISVYVDGMLVGTGTNPSTTLTSGSTTALTIGARMATAAPDSLLNGSIDEVAIYASAHTAAQIASRFAAAA